MANPAVVFDAELRFNDRKVTRKIQSYQNQLNRTGLGNLNTKGITEPLGQISKSAGEFEKSLAASNARVLAFGASVGIIAGVQRAFKALVTETIEVEKALADINVILNETESGLSRFSTELFAIAKNTGQSFKTAADAATEFARQGLGAEETLRRVNDSLILVRLSGIDATRAVEGLTAVVNGFAREALNTTEIINTLANVDAAFAVSTEDLVEALARVGSTAQSAGVGFNELISIVTAAQQITARGGSVIGNSLKTIFTRLQRSSTLDALEDLGIATQNANGGFRDGISLLSDLAGSYDTLQDSQKAYVAELVGGVFQINVLKALLGDLGREVSIYDGALGVANRTTDEAIRRNERLNQTIAASVNEVSNSISELLSNIGKIGADTPIRNILGIVSSITDFLNEGLGEDAGGNIAKGFIKGFGNILSGPGLISAVAIATKLIITTAGFAAKSFKSLIGVGNQAERIKVLQDSINVALAEAGTSYNSILSGAKSVEAAERKVLEILKQQNALRKGNIGINVAASLSRKGVGIKDNIFRQGRFRDLAEGSPIEQTIAREQRSIFRGVGGASRGAEPVIIPDFNFGKGQKGTVVANTDEVVVPNFAGSGGDAVFNKNMIRKFGVPEGAQKLAAKGLIPNFAMPPFEIRPGEIRRTDLLNWFHSLGDQDIFGLEFQKKDGTIRTGSYKRSFEVKSLARTGGRPKKFYSKDIPFSSKRIPLIDFNKLRANKLDPKFKGDNQSILRASFSQAQLSNIRTLSTLGKTYRIVDKASGYLPNMGSFIKNAFKKRPPTPSPEKIGPFETPRAMAANFLRDNAYNVPPISGPIKQGSGLKQRKSIFKERLGGGAFGDVYGSPGRRFVEKVFKPQSGGQLVPELIAQEYLMTKEIAAAGLPIANVRGPLEKALQRKALIKERINGLLEYKVFDRLERLGLPMHQSSFVQLKVGRKFKEDAAKSGIILGGDTSNGGNIIYNISDSEIKKSLLSIGPPSRKSSSGQPEYSASQLNILSDALRKKATMIDQGLARTSGYDFQALGKKYGLNFNFAKGRIPNFVNPALDEAINRELKATGLPKSQIRVESDASLASRFNPLGLGVINTRDEPRGIEQGIKRARQSGIDPRRHGIAVPSFAKGDATIPGLKKLTDEYGDIASRLADELKISSRKTNYPITTALSLAPKEALGENKKLMTRIVSRLMGAADNGAQAIDKAFAESAEDIKRVVPKRLGKFSVTKTVGSEEGGDRVLKSVLRKFGDRPVTLDKNKKEERKGTLREKVEGIKGNSIKKLNAILATVRDDEINGNLPTEAEVRKAIRKSAQAPSGVAEAKRRSDRRIVPYTGIPKGYFSNDIPRLRSGIAEPVDSIPKGTKNAETFMPFFGVTPDNNYGAPPSPPFRRPYDPRSDDNGAPKPKFPIGFDPLKGNTVKKFLGVTDIEKSFSTNLSNVLDKNINDLNRLYSGEKLGGSPTDFASSIKLDQNKILKRGKLDPFNTSRELRVESIRKVLENKGGLSTAQNLNDPRYFKLLTSLEGTKSIELDFQEKVVEKMTRSGLSLEEAMRKSAQEIGKLNKIDASRVNKAVQGSTAALVEYQKSLKATNAALKNSFLEQKLARKESDIFVGVRGDKDITDRERKYLVARERSRYLENAGISKRQFSQFDKSVQNRINSDASTRVFENIIERGGNVNREAEKFGKSGDDTTVTNAKQRAQERKRSKGFLNRSGRFIKGDQFSQAAFLGSFALSGAAGFAGDGTTGKLLQGAGVGASLGLFGGGPGIIVGAALGGIIGTVKGQIDKLSPSLETLDKQFQKLNSNFQKNTEAAQQFIRTQSSLRESIENGADPAQIRTVRKQLAEQFSAITDVKLRKDLLNAGGNTSRQFEVFEESRRRLQGEVSKAGLGSLFASIGKENSFLGISRTNLNIAREKTDSLGGPEFIKEFRRGLFDLLTNNRASSGTSIDQINRLSREVVSAGNLDQSGQIDKNGRAINEEADKAFSSFNTALNSIKSPDGLTNFIKALNNLGLDGEKVSKTFRNTSERLQFLRSVLDFTKEAKEARKLADAQSNAIEGVARFVKELQRLDRFLSIEDQLLNLQRKNQENLDIERRRAILNISGPNLTPRDRVQTSGRIDFDALLSAQKAARREETLKQAESLRDIANTSNKFTKDGIRIVTSRLREVVSSGGSLEPLLLELIDNDNGSIFEREASETRKILTDLLFKSVSSIKIQDESQRYQRDLLRAQIQTKAAIEAQKTLETAIGGRDPIDIGNAIRQGDTSINQLISGFSGAAKAGVTRRLAQSRFEQNPSNYNSNQLASARLDESIKKLEQFKFFENLIGLPSGQLESINQSRRDVGNQFLKANASNQIKSLESSGTFDFGDVLKAIRSGDISRIQEQGSRFDAFSKQGGRTEKERAVASEVSDTLSSLVQGFEAINNPDAFTDPVVKKLAEIQGGPGTITQIANAASQNQKSLDSQFEGMKKILEDNIKIQETGVQIAEKDAEIQSKKSNIDIKKQEILNETLDRSLSPVAAIPNPSYNKLDKSANINLTDFGVATVTKPNLSPIEAIQQKINAESNAGGPSFSAGIFNNVIKGLQNKTFTTLREPTQAILSDSGRKKYGGIIDTVSSLNNGDINEQTVSQFLLKYLSGIGAVGSGDDKTVSKLNSEIQTLEEEIRSQVEAMKVLSKTMEELRADYRADRSGKFGGQTEIQGQTTQNLNLTNDVAKEIRNDGGINDAKRALKAEKDREQERLLKERFSIFNQIQGQRGTGGSVDLGNYRRESEVPRGITYRPDLLQPLIGYGSNRLNSQQFNILENNQALDPSPINTNPISLDPDSLIVLESLQNSLSTFPEELKAILGSKIEGIINNVLEIKGNILIDGVITEEEKEVFNAKLLEAKTEIEELRRRMDGKVATPSQKNR